VLCLTDVAIEYSVSPPAREAREDEDRGPNESLLSEGTRDATEAAERSDAVAGVQPGTETETGTNADRIPNSELLAPCGRRDAPPPAGG